MKSISLLPVEYKNRKKYQRKLHISTIAMGITSGVLVFAYIILRILSTIPETERMVLRAESETLQKEFDALQPLEEFLKNTKQSIYLLQEASKEQIDWLDVFTSMSLYLPENIQITGIMAETEGKNAYLNVKGTAHSHAELAQWMQQLINNGPYSDARLDSSQRTTDSEAIQFELGVTYTQQEPFQWFKEVEP